MSGAPRPKTLTIAFEPPITFNGIPHAAVTLREPTSTEYDEAAKNPGFGLVRHLLVTIGKLPPPVAALAPVSKVREADEFIATFLRPADPPDAPDPEPPRAEDEAIFASMKLREPTLAELDAAGVGRVGTARLVHFTTGIPLEVAMRMPLSRAVACDEYFAAFAAPAPATGTT